MFGGLLEVARDELVMVARNELDDILESNVIDDAQPLLQSQEAAMEVEPHPEPPTGEVEAIVLEAQEVCQACPPAQQVSPQARIPLLLREVHCWGFLLRNDGTQCTPEFTATSRRLKGLLCDLCVRDGVAIDPCRVRILTPDAAANFQNSSSHGLWNHKDGIKYRVINQTARCHGSPMLLLPDANAACPPGLPPIPPAWLRSGKLHLAVSKGTLVPCVAQYDLSTAALQPSGRPAMGAEEGGDACKRPRLEPVLAIPVAVPDPAHGGAHSPAHPTVRQSSALACRAGPPAAAEASARLTGASRIGGAHSPPCRARKRTPSSTPPSASHTFTSTSISSLTSTLTPTPTRIQVCSRLSSHSRKHMPS